MISPTRKPIPYDGWSSFYSALISNAGDIMECMKIKNIRNDLNELHVEGLLIVHQGIG